MNRYMQQMDELQKYYVEQKKPDQKKESILHMISFIPSSRTVKTNL